MISELIEKFISRFECKRPPYATAEEWEEWEEKTRKEQPIRYFLFDTIPRKCRVVKMRFYNAPKEWLSFRTTERYHVIKPKSLKPGYTCKSDLVLHASFAMLTEYVENTLPRRSWSFWNDGRPEGMSNFKWRFHPNYKPNTLENRIAAGLAYLDWEITDTATQGTQAKVTQELKDLYLWWTEQRPQRLNPWSDEKLTSLQTPEDLAEQEGRLFVTNIPASTKRFWDCAQELDQFYLEQDQAMLEALIKIRQHLD